MNKKIEEKLRKDGYSYWEVAEKDIKRMYINDSLKFLDLDGKDAYTKPLIINNIDFSEYCLNVRKTLYMLVSLQNHCYLQNNHQT